MKIIALSFLFTLVGCIGGSSSSSKVNPDICEAGIQESGYATSIAVYPKYCQRVTKTCPTSGSWQGERPQATCVQSCKHPLTNQIYPAGATITLFSRATGTPAQCEAAKLIATCNQNSGVFVNASGGSFLGCSEPLTIGNSYYMGPSGADTNSGLSQAQPLKTFAKAFTLMSPGDQLFLLDGNYTSGAEGSLNDSTLPSPIPSGERGKFITIRALNTGMAVHVGKMELGSASHKAEYIKIQGIRFSGGDGAQLTNTKNIYLKELGFDGPLLVGSANQPYLSSNNLIEDVWVWGSGTSAARVHNLNSNQNVWRRVVVRSDGCGLGMCQSAGTTNPVGFKISDSKDILVMNSIVLDGAKIMGELTAVDFGIKGTNESLVNIKILGSMSLFSPGASLVFDNSIAPPSSDSVPLHLENFVLHNLESSGIVVSGNSDGSIVKNITTYNAQGSAVVISPVPHTKGAVENLLIRGLGDVGARSAILPEYVSLTGTWTEPLQLSSPQLISGDPIANGSLKYLTRIEASKPLKRAGKYGADVGANVFNRIGVDGAFYGDPNADIFTLNFLWPFPGESTFRQSMCQNTTRGFCSNGMRIDGINPITFSSYIWEILGNGMPSNF